MTTSRFQVPVDYILKHYKPDDRLAAVLIYRGEGTVRHEFASAAQISAPKYQAHLRGANANGADIYLSVNTLKPGARSRTKADIGEIRHIYLDVDTDGDTVLKNILADAAIPKPTTVLQSSPGKYQILWRVEGFEKEKAEATVRGMAAQFNADQAVWDCARILRIPGYRNVKYQTPHYVHEVAGERTEGVLTPDDFPEFPEITYAGAPRSVTHAGGSQSEADWAFTLRSLERGVAPAEIEEQLRDYRRDKPNPEYYAKRTVERARQKLGL